jgi:hypothetical protein
VFFKHSHVDRDELLFTFSEIQRVCLEINMSLPLFKDFNKVALGKYSWDFDVAILNSFCFTTDILDEDYDFKNTLKVKVKAPKGVVSTMQNNLWKIM